MVFRFSNLACESYNEKLFVFHSCRLKAISRDKVTMNMNGTVMYSGKNIKFHVRIFKRENGFKPWLFNVKFDGCRFMQKRNVPIIKILFNSFKEYSNLNHTCPFVGPLIIQGFYLKPELLVLPIPTGEYMISFRWFYDDKLQSDLNVSFVYVEDIKVGETK
ncbi:uncharacterized protein LOC110177976 [Drosophila serrata]|uniref:uncharacterized protein LOC110177976 n=1 Tax=Drosophila serrata TaxID=7274 RepID=UPI000A1D3600|nr:uncharacterized protein LOC110177976 [Drosophila serrata]